MSFVKLLRRGVFANFYSLFLKKLRDKQVLFFIDVGQTCINYERHQNSTIKRLHFVQGIFSTSSGWREFEINKFEVFRAACPSCPNRERGHRRLYPTAFVLLGGGRPPTNTPAPVALMHTRLDAHCPLLPTSSPALDDYIAYIQGETEMFSLVVYLVSI